MIILSINYPRCKCKDLVIDSSKIHRYKFQIEGKLNYLVSARPTAVNIKLAADELINLANTLSADENVSPSEFKDRCVCP